MAFFVKNSQPLALLLKNPKCYDFNRIVISSQFAKFSSSAYVNSALFFNDSKCHSKCRSRSTNRWNCSNHYLVSPHISALHFMSTDSHVDNLQVTSSGRESLFTPSVSTESSHENQVIFTDNIPDSTREVIDPIVSNLPADLSPVLNVVDPSLASLGLGSWYTPVGIIQQLLDFLHTSGQLPWWLCIVLVTGLARTLMMPIFIKTQRNAANIANYMPRLHYYQAKFNEARKSGNMFESSKIGNEMMTYMKDHNINPIKNVIWPLAQAPVFISFFWALRNMAKLPVESLKVGGFSWIMDLTIPDPYYIMPLIASSTLFVILKVGAESGIRMENMKLSRYFIMAIPVIVFPICMHMQSAVLFYWCTNNFITLGLVLLLKIEALRVYFGISKIVKQDVPELSTKKKGFIASVKESFQDQKILHDIEERGRIDHIRFKKAGTGPIPRTYAYDPTKPRPAVSAAAAKAVQTKSSSSKVN